MFCELWEGIGYLFPIPSQISSSLPHLCVTHSRIPPPFLILILEVSEDSSTGLQTLSPANAFTELRTFAFLGLDDEVVPSTKILDAAIALEGCVARA